MITSMSSQNRLLLAVLVVAAALALAALACSPSVGPSATSVPVGTKAGSPTAPGQATESAGGATTAPGATNQSGAPSGGEITAGNAANIVELHTVTVSTQPVLASAISGASHTIATLGVDRTVRLWDGDTGNKLKELPKHADLGFGLAYSKDGSLLASGAGFNVTIWDPSSGKRIKSITPNAAVYRMAFSPDAKTLVVAGEGRSKLDIIDVGTGQVTSTLASPQGFVLWSANYSSDGTKLAVADNHGNFTVFDAASKSQLGAGSADGAAWDVEFSPDGKYVTTCNGKSDVGGINTWDTSNFSSYASLTLPEIHKGGCTDGVYAKNGDVYFSVGADGVLNAWDVSSGKLLFSKTYGSAAWTVSISGDGKILAVTLDDGTMHILGLK